MEWGLVKRHVMEEIARLSREGKPDSQEKADALEQCLKLAGEVQLAREVSADLREKIRKREDSLQEIERRFCQCDLAAGRVCALHALVQEAIDGDVSHL
jgi:hypothetical protein